MWFETFIDSVHAGLEGEVKANIKDAIGAMNGAVVIGWSGLSGLMNTLITGAGVPEGSSRFGNVAGVRLGR